MTPAHAQSWARRHLHPDAEVTERLYAPRPFRYAVAWDDGMGGAHPKTWGTGATPVEAVREACDRWDVDPPMDAMQATHHAHTLWHEHGIGVAVLVNGVYQVGLAKDHDSLEVAGRSEESFEDAFRRALGEDV